MPITILDHIISNNVRWNNEIADSAEDVSILKRLFGYYLSPWSQGKIKGNQYIFDTFQCFANHKETIKINIAYLDWYCHNKDLLALLFDKIINTRYNPSSDSLTQNILRKDVIKIFKNVKTLRIWAGDYKLSLLSLLSLIDGTQITEVKIYNAYWIGAINSSSSINDIVNKYKNANYEVKIKEYTIRIVKE